MNIFTIVGAVLSGGSAVGLVVASAQWGIRDVIDDFTGKGRRTAIARLEAQRDAVTGSQTSGFIQKYSAVDNLKESDFHRFSKTGTTGNVRSSVSASSSVSDMLQNQPNQLQVKKPTVKSTEDLLRADVDDMDYNVSTDVSERTEFLDDPDSGGIEGTSILMEEDDFEGSGSFFNRVLSDGEVSQTSILEPEVSEMEMFEKTESLNEATTPNLEDVGSRRSFIVTFSYDNIEL